MKYTCRSALAAHLREGLASWHSVYLIVGKDEWQRRVAEELLWEALPRGKRISWQGGLVTPQQLEEELETFDLFTSHRLLRIRDVEALGKEAQRKLVVHLSRKEGSLHLILSAAALAASSPLYKAVDEHGCIVAVEQLRARDREHQCEAWLIERARASGKVLSAGAATLLRRHLGIDYYLLVQELEKLIAYAGAHATIAEEAVYAVTQAVHVDTIWQLGEALLQNNMRAALTTCHHLLASGMALIAIVRQIRRQFQTAFEVADLSGSEVAGRHPDLKDFMVERQRRLAASYGRRRLSSAICALDACELAFKNGCDQEKLLLEQLVMRLSFGLSPQLKLPLGAVHVL